MTKADFVIHTNTIPILKKNKVVKDLNIVKLFRKVSNDQPMDGSTKKNRLQGLVWQSDDLYSLAWYINGQTPKPTSPNINLHYTDRLYLGERLTGNTWMLPFSEYNKIEGLKSARLQEKTRFDTAQKVSMIGRHDMPKIIFARLISYQAGGKITSYGAKVWVFHVAEPIQFGNEPLYAVDSMTVDNTGNCSGFNDWIMLANVLVGANTFDIRKVIERISVQFSGHYSEIPVKNLANFLDSSTGVVKVKESNQASYCGVKFDKNFVDSRISENHPKYSIIKSLVEDTGTASPLDYFDTVNCVPNFTKDCQEMGIVSKLFRPQYTFNEFIELQQLDVPLPKHDSIESFLTTYA